MRLPTHRAPTHPGEILLEEWLRLMSLTQLGLAKKTREPPQLAKFEQKRFPVELRGIEPLTSSMPWMRSPS